MTDAQTGTGPQAPIREGSSEVVIVDRDDRVRQPLAQLLTASGLLVTSVVDAEKAVALAGEKFFSVALVDADSPTPDQGIAVMQRLRQASPQTQLILLVNRQTFDLATRGFRAGAADVVAKAPDAVKALVAEVLKLSRQAAQQDQRDLLLRETLEVHEAFLKRLMDASRKSHQAEENARGQSGRWELKECVVLVVDENPRTAAGLQEALGRGSYRCLSACNGGEALDLAGQHKFQVALVNERLPDLPQKTVVKGLRSQSDGIVLAFSHPGASAGQLRLIEEHQEIVLVAELTRADQLVTSIQEMREAYLAKSRERHYLQAFRAEHYDFLKRYVELRQKLSALLPGRSNR